MSVILHFSDLHFGTERPQVVEALIRLVKKKQPDLAILSGDVTQRARARQFAKAKLFFNRLEIPEFLIIAGNHDIPLYNLIKRFNAPYSNFTETFGNHLEPVIDSGNIKAIGIKTTRRYRHKNGEISKQQIDNVTDLLAKSRQEQLKIVICHHPVFPIKGIKTSNLLNGRMQALQAWSDVGVDLVLGGHIHLPYIVPLHQKFSDLEQPIWAVQAGTALSSRVRGNINNSVNLINYHIEGINRICSVERWDYHDEQAAFSCIKKERLELSKLLANQ